jgi:hypothetical protein
MLRDARVTGLRKLRRGIVAVSTGSFGPGTTLAQPMIVVRSMLRRS